MPLNQNTKHVECPRAERKRNPIAVLVKPELSAGASVEQEIAEQSDDSNVQIHGFPPVSVEAHTQ